MIKKNKKVDINYENIPKHIGIIMDGNGRWAKKKFLPRALGHRQGGEASRNIIKECSKLGVKYLTLYAFSSENWSRSQDEIDTLMNLLVEYLTKEIDELDENNVIINQIGDISRLPQKCIDKLRDAHDRTKNNTGLTLNLAINYGGRNEIIKAIKEIATLYKDGEINISNINESLVSDHLYTKGMDDPELIIRTSNEFRTSNFLTWQSIYSEYHITEILWPDFGVNDLHEAIYEYQNRNRRFGGRK